MEKKNIIKFTDLGKTCPVRGILDHIGNKWSINIIYALTENGPLRFGELLIAVDGISQKMLTTTLRILEKDGLILRKMYPVIPPKVEYSLSVLGEDLSPLLKKLVVWAQENRHTIEKNQQVSDSLI